MGFKRPFDIEEFQGLPFKQARAPCGDKMNKFVNTVTCDNILPKPDVLGEGGNDGILTRCVGHGQFGDMGVSPVPNLTKDIDSNTPLPLVFSSSNDEDVVSGEAKCSPFPDYFNFDFPRRIITPFKDSDTSYWDRFPRKQVYIGPNFQAKIPPWSGNSMKNGSEQIDSSKPNDYLLCDSNCHMDDEEKKLMGTCILPMPELESFADDVNNVGCGRTDCGCLDADSVRCVRQHIMETIENLRKSIGHDKFVDLGFYDMGEEVACQWSEEEEPIFRSVVYSNPASLGHNFWKHLSEVFPTRSTKEIVSYYFNVFMLRRRASQNRSKLPDIDSDDDEWHRISQSSNKVLEQDEDSGIESPGDCCEAGDILADNEDDKDNEDNDDSSDDSDGNQGDEIDDDDEDATGEDSGIEYGLEVFDVFSYDMSKYHSVAKHADCKTRVVEEDFAVQEDSCMSFEFQTDKLDTCGPLDSGASFQLSGDSNAYGNITSGELNGGADLDGQVFLLDSCDSKLWDARFSSSIKGVDLLPTCNLIEEFFGRGTK